MQLHESTTTSSLVFATLTSRVKRKSFACHSYRKHPGWGYPLAPRAAVLSSNAAAFDFSPAIPPPPRLRPFPAHQLNLHSAVQSVRHANQRPHRQIPRLILHRRNLGREDQSELPSPPILPEQPFHPPKLLRIRSHQCHLSRQRLPRYQEVVCSDGFPAPLQSVSDFAGIARVLFPELQHPHRPRKKHLQAQCIRFRLDALCYAIPKFVQRHRRHPHLLTRLQRLGESLPNRFRCPVDQRDAHVRIKQIVHRKSQSKILRRGARGCFRPPFSKGSPPIRSIAANHSLGSEIIGSSKTPSGTRRTRTLSPSKRNSRGSRTAWLRPFRNNFATPLFAMRPPIRTDIYHKSIPAGKTRRVPQPSS